MNQLILGDNMEIMKKMDAESIDLIYLDPPFFSNRNYEVIWGDKGEVRSFEDRWSGGVEHYIGWLKERVEEMYRLLKPTGSIYLHCDWHAFAEIKVMILDKLFGNNNFKNMITWKRSDTHNDAKKQFPIVSDYLFFYTKTNQIKIITFNKQYTSHADKTLKEWYQYLEYPDGSVRKMTKEELATQEIPINTRRFNADNMASPNPRPNLMYEYKGFSYPLKGWRYSKETMVKLDNEGKLLFPAKQDGRIMLKRYLDEQQGAVVGDVWTDIDQIRAAHVERIGYPTQKPEKLLERIIQASSNEGDIVFDPFVGGGTTVVVAEKLNRKWIGIDQSVQAVKVSEMRLNKIQNMFSAPFTLQLHKYDYDTLFNQNPKEFEIWIVERFGGKANIKKGGDRGIDGKMQDGTPIQVKQSESVSSMPIRQLVTDAKASDRNLFIKNQSEDKPIAYFIAFSFGRGAIEEVARLKREENVIIKLVKVEEIIPIAKKPKMSVSIADKSADAKGNREIEFIAKAVSEAGIEFYAFDFDYSEETKIFSAEQMLNKEGIATWKFKPGTHTIAVKAIDNEGLEAIEVLKIKVNGVVERE
jgi:DNA modification methylase